MNSHPENKRPTVCPMIGFQNLNKLCREVCMLYLQRKAFGFIEKFSWELKTQCLEKTVLNFIGK